MLQQLRQIHNRRIELNTHAKRLDCQIDDDAARMRQRMYTIGHGFYGQGKSGKVRESQRIKKRQGILHSKIIRENSEGQGKSRNLKVPGCKS